MKITLEAGLIETELIQIESTIEQMAEAGWKGFELTRYGDGEWVATF